jgi:hypothetical protein
MQTNPASPQRPEKPQVLPPDPATSADDTSVDAGAAENAKNVDDKNPVQPQRISREAAEKGIAPDADPDDPVSP